MKRYEEQKNNLMRKLKSKMIEDEIYQPIGNFMPNSANRDTRVQKHAKAQLYANAHLHTNTQQPVLLLEFLKD